MSSRLSRHHPHVFLRCPSPAEHPLHLLVLHPLEHPQELPPVLHPTHPLVLHPLECSRVLHLSELHPMEHLLELHPTELYPRLPPPWASHQLTSNAWRTSWLTGSSCATSPPPAAQSL